MKARVRHRTQHFPPGWQKREQTPEHLERALFDAGGTYSQFELMAGIDTHNPAERAKFWELFAHLDPEEAEVEGGDELRERVLARVKAGELCLL